MFQNPGGTKIWTSAASLGTFWFRTCPKKTFHQTLQTLNFTRVNPVHNSPQNTKIRFSLLVHTKLRKLHHQDYQTSQLRSLTFISCLDKHFRISSCELLSLLVKISPDNNPHVFLQLDKYLNTRLLNVMIIKKLKKKMLDFLCQD